MLHSIESRQQVVLDKVVETLATCQNIIQERPTLKTGNNEENIDINFQFDSEIQLQEFDEKLGANMEFKSQLVNVF